jgi:Acetyltransferase (GNAT) family
MVFRGEIIRSATLSTFMVHQEHRGRGIGRELLAHYLDGPQDFSWSDVANMPTRRLWHSLGGRTAWMQNVSWHRPIRPLRSASAQWNLNAAGKVARLGFRPLAFVLDVIATRLSFLPSHVPTPVGTSEALSPKALAKNAPEILADYALRPVYTTVEIEGLIRHLEAKPLGSLYQALIRGMDGRIAGWFIYFVNPRGTSQVVQIAARQGATATVFDHLVHHAWKHGVVALTGRVDAQLLSHLQSQALRLAREDPWVLVHSRRTDVLDAIQGGEAFLSRLEGEWWLAA